MYLLSFVKVLETSGYIFLALFCLMFMVVIHELGHYIAGKLLGFKIIEFSVGFGPVLVKRTNKKNGEIFSIRALPLGGFCQFEDENEDSKSATAFNNQHPLKRIVVLFSGAFLNFITGLLLIIIFFIAFGQVLPQTSYVFEDSANANILQEGDIFIKVNNKTVNILTAEDLSNVFESDSSNQKVSAVVLRDGKKVKIQLEKGYYISQSLNEGGYEPDLDENFDPVIKYGYGFSAQTGPQKLPILVSIEKAFSFIFFVVYKIFSSIAALIMGKIPIKGNLGGPITTIGAMAKAGQSGFASLFYIVCILSANLAVLNLLPIPALDGSKILFVFIEWVTKKPINKKLELILSIIGIVLLLSLAFFADLSSIFKIKVGVP